MTRYIFLRYLGNLLLPKFLIQLYGNSLYILFKSITLDILFHFNFILEKLRCIIYNDFLPLIRIRRFRAQLCIIGHIFFVRGGFFFTRLKSFQSLIWNFFVWWVLFIDDRLLEFVNRIFFIYNRCLEFMNLISRILLFRRGFELLCSLWGLGF